MSIGFGKLLLELLLLVLGFVLLVKGADFFVDGAASIAKKLKVPARIGQVFTADMFYNANAEAGQRYKDFGILAVEMETAGIYWEAMASKKRALSLLSISDHIFTGEGLSAEDRQDSFRQMMETALETAWEFAEC